jgi:hypothetical protein
MKVGKAKVNRQKAKVKPAFGWTASVIPLENGIQVKGMGMDPGFHRGDDKAGKPEKEVDFESTFLKPFGLEPEGCLNSPFEM